MANITLANKDLTKLIASNAAKASTIAAIPIPLIDIAGVVYIQMNMIDKIADHHGKVISQKQYTFTSTLITAVITKLLTLAVNSVTKQSKINRLFGEALVKATFIGISTTAIGELYNLHFSNGGQVEELGFDTVQNYLQIQMASDRLSFSNISSNMIKGLV